MPFKIVQAKEDGKICLSVVPSHWEINGNLWWPPTPMSNISSKENSKPKSTWLKYSCVVKRVFSKYELAVQEQKKMEMQTDTEEDEEVVEPLIYAQQNLPLLANQHSYAVNKINKPQYDFNEYLIVPSSNQLVNKQPPPEPPISASNEDSLVNISLSDVNLESPFFVTSQNDNLVIQNQKKIIELLETQKQNISNILTQLAKHEVIFEELYKKFDKIEDNRFTPSNVKTVFERFPSVKSIKELQELEEKLKEPSFRQRYIELFMSVLCSEGSNLRGNNLCYKMVDFFMARDIFLECSWTGNTRDDLRTEKKPFKLFENVRATFLSVIRATDSSFGQLQCDDFFKRIIKNSKQRFEAATKPVSSSTPKRKSRKRARPEPSQEDMEIELEEVEAEQLHENREPAREFQEDRKDRQHQEDSEARQHQENMEARQLQKGKRARQHQEDVEVGQLQEEREPRQRKERTDDKKRLEDTAVKQYKKDNAVGQSQEYNEDRQRQKSREVRKNQEDMELEDSDVRQRQESKEETRHHQKEGENGQRRENIV